MEINLGAEHRDIIPIYSNLQKTQKDIHPGI